MSLLQTSPQKIPNTNFAFGSIITASVIFDLSASLLTRDNLTLVSLFAPPIISMMLSALIIQLILLLHGQQQLFRQTWSAFLAISCVIGLFLLPLNVLHERTNVQPLIQLTEVATLACFGWWLVAIGHVFRKSTGVSLLQGTCVALLAFTIDVIMFDQLFIK